VNPLARERRSRDTRPQPARRPPAPPCKAAQPPPPPAMKRLALLFGETEMYIYDVLGSQEGDPIRKLPGVAFLTPSRGVKRAQWTLSGTETCTCCE